MMTTEDPALPALQNAIREQAEKDPHVAAKIASKELLERFLTVMKDDKGVHVESVFVALGALAGFACQQSALTRLARKETQASLMTITDNNGKNYYLGDAINQPLLEDRLSVASLVGGALESYGETLCDIEEIVKHTIASIGTEAFGQPRLPENHQAHYQPLDCLKLWQPLKEQILDVFLVPASDWGLAYGLAIQSFMEQAKTVLSPDIAGIIVMEAAIPMSKVIYSCDK